MKKETITYTDFNGETRTEDFLFNLTTAELTEMQYSINGGISEKLKNIKNTQDIAEAMKFFKDLILKSYGEKDLDGKRFIKVKNGERLADAFSETEAYSVLFMKLASDEKAASDFINGVVPADLAKKAAALELKTGVDAVEK